MNDRTPNPETTARSHIELLVADARSVELHLVNVPADARNALRRAADALDMFADGLTVQEVSGNVRIAGL